MTYATSGVIQASDYNGFASNNTPNVNNIWATGSGNSGYGQPSLPVKQPGDTILTSDWFSLFSAVNDSAAHQGTSITPLVNGLPTAGSPIAYEPGLDGNIPLIDANRGNAVAHGSTSFSTATSTSSWTNSLTTTFTVTFASDNAARWYFNAGGQIGFTFNHPAGLGSGVNLTISQICANAGTLWFSSPDSGSVVLNGTTYTGVTKVGGSNPGSTTVYTNNGFYSVYPTGTQLLLKQYSSGGGYYPYYYYYYYPYYGYGSNSFLQISANYNNSGVLTFTCLLDEVPDGATVTPGTVSTLILRPPSTLYLTNSWGTPTVGSTITPV